MRLLVLGGTAFLSREAAVAAVARGHEVHVACRGTGALPDGVRHLVLDRAAEPPRAVAATLSARYDAVVDVARTPSWVRAAVAATRSAHWVYVSSISAYPDTATPGAVAGDLARHEPEHADRDPAAGPEVYGAMKVACEDVVRAGTASSTLVRPGLIVGPGDPTGRFTYWPRRLDPGSGDPVLAPGHPDDTVQVIDVRDLAAWLVDLAEARTVGAFDAVGHPQGRGAFLGEVAAGCGADPFWRWVDQDTLAERGVEPWMGERSVPLWLPVPELAGLMAHDPAPALAAGLRLRPVAQTAADTLAWLRADPDAPATGLTRKQEREVLAGSP